MDKTALPTELRAIAGWQLRRALLSCEVSAVEIARHVLDRIDALNPALHAFITLAPDSALAAAAALDQSLARGDAAGPLAGIPVSIKDQVWT